MDYSQPNPGILQKIWKRISGFVLFYAACMWIFLAAWIPFRCRNSWMFNEFGEKGLDLFVFILICNLISVGVLFIVLLYGIRIMPRFGFKKIQVSRTKIFLIAAVINLVVLLFLRVFGINAVPPERYSSSHNPNRNCGIEPAYIWDTPRK